MPRVARSAPGDLIYHVLNRGNGRRRLFHKPSDYDAFIALLLKVQAALPMRILAICLMPNHWHLVLWPLRDRDLSKFMLRLTTAHVRRYHAHYHSDGGGHLYQGRFKSFVTQDDDHLLVLLRYVESNAVRAGLVEAAAAWRWCSAALRESESGSRLLCQWPIQRPRNWSSLLARPMRERELELVQMSVVRGRPLGSQRWVAQMVKRLGLEFTLRPRGRPRKTEDK